MGSGVVHSLYCIYQLSMSVCVVITQTYQVTHLENVVRFGASTTSSTTERKNGLSSSIADVHPGM